MHFSWFQELKGLLLEAQKGPESLQEALKVQAGNHRSQQEELRTIIDSLRLTLNDSSGPRAEQSLASAPPAAWKELQLGGRQTRSLLESLPPQMGQLRLGLSSVQGELSAVRKLLESKQDGAQAAGPRLAPAEGEPAHSQTLLGCLQDSQRTLGHQLRTSTVYSAVFSYTAATVAVCALYLLLRGSG